MATRDENIAKIRNAVYGREVREAIAEGMEQTYDQCEDMSIVTAGGTTGQVLAKRSNADWDTEWVTGGGGGGAVDSVNGQTGVVVLDADDVGALPDTTTAADLGAYVKPSGGIPASDLASAVQTSLGKADSAYQKPSGGIPAADLASGVIPSVPSAYTSTPSPLGTAAAGSSSAYAKGDHVHAMPTAADVGAIAAPSSPASGAFLVWNGSAWVAQTLSTWQGGSY